MLRRYIAIPMAPKSSDVLGNSHRKATRRTKVRFVVNFDYAIVP